MDDPNSQQAALHGFNPSLCTLVDGHPCAACLDIYHLNLKIQQAQDVLDRLLQERKTKYTYNINPIHDPLTRHLPVELISQIFSACLDGAQEAIGNGYSVSKVRCSVPLIISAVCKAWRRAAFATPELWTIVNIYVYSRDRAELQAELVQEWLARSGHLPLHLSLFSPDSSSRTFSYLSPIFDALKKHVGRWRSLRLMVSRECYTAFTAGLTNAPNLRTLRLRPHWDPDRTRVGKIFTLRQAPVLEELRTNNLRFEELHLDWSNLTTIYMEGIRINWLLKVFQLAVKLRTGVFASLMSPEANHSPPENPVICRLLEELELQTQAESSILFSRLTLPSLRKLIYRSTASRGQFPTDEFLALLQRSRCLIQDLEVREPYRDLVDQDWLQALQHQSSIKRISLDYILQSSQGDAIQVTPSMDALFRQFESDPTFLPNLERLDISSPQAFTWKVFSSFLDACYARMTESKANASYPGFLETQDIPQGSIHSNYDNKRRQLKIFLRLDRHPLPPSNTIGPDIANRLINAIWKDNISLVILDKQHGTDLLQASAR